MKLSNWTWLLALAVLIPPAMLLTAPPGPASQATQPSLFQTTPTPCPIPTQVPLWVDPVLSPTSELSQTVTALFGGHTVTVTAESGIFVDPTAGEPVSGLGTFAVDIDLLPNTAHHLEVAGTVPDSVTSPGCIWPSYTLHTTQDRNGAPLIIEQIGIATPTNQVYLPLIRRGGTEN